MKLETFFEHFDLLAEAPNSVQKLRELILDLAVRGKLVPQDANDEPAAVLLERIKKEKERLVKEKKISKLESLPAIKDDEIPYDLPKSWEWVRLGNIGETNIGLTYSPSDISDTGIPVLRSSNIQSGKICLTDLKRVNTKIKESNFVHTGDLLICARNGSKHLVGKTALIQDLPEVMAFGAFMAIFRSRCNEYLLYFINSPLFRRMIDDVNTTTINQITQQNLKSTIFPLPPLNEQKRIVSKVDELMKLCDELEARQKKKRETRILINNAALNKLLTAETPETFTKNWQRIGDNFDILYSAPENIGKLRQAILQLAVMGKLVPQDANDEPAAVLLERIKKEKERLVKEGKIKNEQSIVIDGNLYQIPKQWELVSLNQIIALMDSGWSPACKNHPTLDKSKWGVLKTTAVQPLVYKEEEHKELPEHLEPRPDYEVQVGDLLITRAGPKNRVGICCLVKKTRPKLMISDKIIRFHLFEPFIFPDFIVLILNTGFSQSFIETQKSGMAESQMNISQAKLRMTPIPLPPFNEQKRIVTKVDKLMKLCDELETKLTQTQTESEKIINAAVKQLLTV
ncbi:restriction endonuclease subunit S [Dolichospermum circinale]|uniref:restriction endonuclease subunit S n=1 Tax=Dolichospermum circinale TaxID=109265 RepID=UPI00232F9B77|nr:restriction endonuclease subunit S [Dolichospermum circinale]MDB9448532.1 restriction endonuclease subunit S [Dolichospermum circinale CS-547]